MLAFAFLAGCGGGSSDSNQTSAPPGGTPPPPGSNSPPSIAGTPATLTFQGTPYSFVPVASDPDGDTLRFSVTNRPLWATFDADTGRLDGSPGAADVGTHRGIAVAVSDGEAEVQLPLFDIVVEPAYDGAFTLSWQAPVENTDGSTLNNLHAFRIYWGPAQDNYSSQLTVDNPGITSHVFTNLEPGKYYFSASAVNTFGYESELSDYAVIMIQ
jgi:hypothetical protein